MKLDGNSHIDAPRERVFAYFTDAQFVADCAPGVERLEVLEPDKKFKIVASVGFGMIKASFDTTVEFLGKQAPERATIKASGRAPGSTVSATADLVLSDGAQGGTDLHWAADVNIGGTIAAVAMRLMGSVTQKLSAQFFDCAKGKIEHPDA